MDLLPPTNDLVFRTLLVRAPVLIRDMIAAVVSLPAPIREVAVLNPELPRSYAAEKGIVLDVCVTLDSGEHVDIEMQCDTPVWLAPRLLYYWARNYTLSLQHGQHYNKLRPAISIVWLAAPLLKSQQFHSIFRLNEDRTHELLTSHLEIHILELSKLTLDIAEKAPATRWGRFLVAQSEDELDALAQEDPIMTTAKETLVRLSSDPTFRSEAWERQRAHETWLIMVGEERAAGLAEGLEKGLEQGKQEGLELGKRALVRRQLERRFGSLDPEWSARLDQAGHEAIERIADRILTASSIAEVFEE